MSDDRDDVSLEGGAQNYYFERARRRVPDHTLQALDAYVEHGVMPGGFLTAVLEHELFEAFGRADVQNKPAIGHIVSYIYNYCPYNCHGDEETVKEYSKAMRRGREGEN